MIYLVIIHNKIHEPKSCSFAHCGGLCRLKMGEAEATAWGCDLTYDYVKINGDYRT